MDFQLLDLEDIMIHMASCKSSIGVKLCDAHNIIQIHNNVLCDWQYYVEYPIISYLMCGIFRKILSVPHNININMNIVM